MSACTLPLFEVFADMENYAWQLLQGEVQLELAKDVCSAEIANLLSLYMRGVERLNSVQDQREAFFLKRVTTLMMRPNVVKSFSTPAKQKVVTAPPARQPEKEVMQLSQIAKPTPQAAPSVPCRDPEQKRKQLEMHLAYQSDEHSPERLTMLISQHNTKAHTLNSCIENAISDNSRRIEERIKRRQMKSLAARSFIETPEGVQAQEGKRQLRDMQAIKEQATPKADIKPEAVQRKKSLDRLPSLSNQQLDTPKKRRRGSAYVQTLTT